MIAQPNRHYDHDTLRKLLEESLPEEEMSTVEDHLSQCDKCRDRLEELAGESIWWEETVSVLSQTTAGVQASINQAAHASAERRRIDSSLQWIEPLLDETDQEGCLGRIDQYVVHEVIGQGGMGVVLGGVDPQLNRPIAIKVLSPHLAGVGAARVRFMREAQAAAAIVHPSIVPIYSVASTARLPYIVMPCIGGGNLQQQIDREGPLEIAEVLRIGLQIAEGLSAAHRHGVMHRDIKPGNILVEEGNGRVLISDFGLARALDDATLTVSGMIAGTPQFMSPEQARGEPIDARSDLYSLGSLLYALATGRPPFRAESPLAVLRKISETRPRPIHEINERIPPWFDVLVQRLMTNDVNQRIADAESVSNLLSDAHAHVRNPSVNHLPSDLIKSPYRGGMIAAAAACALLAVGGGYLLSQAQPQQTQQQTSDARSALTSPTVDPNGPPSAAMLDWHNQAGQIELIEIGMQIAELENEVNQEVVVETSPITPAALPTGRSD